jgi:hypothetical protein
VIRIFGYSSKSLELFDEEPVAAQGGDGSAMKKS